MNADSDKRDVRLKVKVLVVLSLAAPLDQTGRRGEVARCHDGVVTNQLNDSAAERMDDSVA